MLTSGAESMIIATMRGMHNDGILSGSRVYRDRVVLLYAQIGYGGTGPDEHVRVADAANRSEYRREYPHVSADLDTLRRAEAAGQDLSTTPLYSEQQPGGRLYGLVTDAGRVALSQPTTTMQALAQIGRGQQPQISLSYDDPSLSLSLPADRRWLYMAIVAAPIVLAGLGVWLGWRAIGRSWWVAGLILALAGLVAAGVYQYLLQTYGVYDAA